MEIQSSSSAVLVVADGNFRNLCKDPTDYLARLKKALAERAARLQTAISFFTISGKYGVSNIDSDFSVIEIDDKNKTAFGQTLENTALLFEEMVAVSNTPDDPYMTTVREVATETGKTMTHYKYERRPVDGQK